jgi:glycosyltransferase involved in cell wall biosynthesis
MILASLPPMPVGGAEVQAIELCRHLQQMGVNIHVITWGKIWHRKTDVYKGIPFTRISSVLDIAADLLSLFKRKEKKTVTKILYDDSKERTREISGKVWAGMVSRYTLFYINSLVYLWLRRNKFDIIHAHMMEWPAFTAVRLGRRLNKPVIIKDSTMNGIFSILRYPGGNKKQQDIIRHAYCIAMTRMIRENLLKAGVPPTRIANIPNGIETIPLLLKIKSWSNKVIFVGNLTQQPAKGIDILLLAWKLVVNRFPLATLEIIGDGDIAAYEKFSSENNITRVLFPGRQHNIKARLQDADIFVLPSRREGMSNALMEAMICGMPVVATKVSGSEDLVENHVSGLLVPSGDIDELAAAIIYLMDHQDEAMQMGRNAYLSVTEKCDIKKVAAQYISLYHKILALD